MTDQDIQFIFPRGKAVRKTTVAARSRKYPELIDYLSHRFPEDNVSPQEAIARIWLKIEHRPHCPTCGTEIPFSGRVTVPFHKYCKHSCQLKDPYFLEHRGDNVDRERARDRRRATLKQRYGSETYNNRESAQKTMLKRYGGKTTFESKELVDKVRQAVQEKYGVDNVRKAKVVIEHSKQTKQERYGDPNYTNREQAKQTMLERYGASTTLESGFLQEKVKATSLKRYGNAEFRNSAKAKETMIERYGISNAFQLGNVREKIDYGKINQTRKSRGNLNTSVQEDRLQSILEKLLPDAQILEQYTDERYKNPETGRKYYCDFYLPEYDLFIDLNAHYSHGKGPFRKDSDEDKALLESCREKSQTKKAYGSIANVWGHRDIIKREEAKRSHICRIEIFGCNFTEKSVAETLREYCPEIKAIY